MGTLADVMEWTRADRIAMRHVGRTLAETLRCLKKLVESGDRIARAE
jgi:hypothetical protein